MSIAHVATGTAVGTTNNPSPSISGTASAGELLVAYLTGRFSSAAAPSRTGWQLATPSNNPGGTGTDAADTGTTDCWICVRHALSTDTGAQTFTTSGDCHQAVISRFSKDSGKWWSLEGTGGGDTTVDTAFSAAGSAIGLAANDMLVSCAVAPSDTPTWSSKLLAASGITFGTQVSDVADFSTTSGSDQRGGILRAPVNSGAGNVAPTYSHTASANGGGSGSAAFLRLREIDAPTFKAEIGAQPGTTSVGMTLSGLGAAIGDMAVISVAHKPATATAPPAPSGWTAGPSVVVGTGSDGVDTGQVRISFYYMELTTATPPDPTFTPGGAGSNVAQGNGMLWSKPAGTNWKTPAFTIGDDNTSGTSYSATGSNLNGAPGDHYYLCSYMTRGSNISSGRSSVVPGAILDYFGVSSAFTSNGNHLAFWLDRGQGMAPQTGGATQSATYAAAQSGGSAQAVVGLSTSLTAAANPATETDSAQPIGRVKARAVGVASETDAAQALARTKSRAAGAAAETDAAVAVGRRKTRSAGIGTEVDTAVAITRSGQTLAVGTVTETDAAVAVARLKARAVGIPLETDTAVSLARSKRRTAAPAGETDTAVAAGRVKTRTVGTVAESDAAVTVSRRKARALLAAAESDTATAAGRRKTRTVASATEVDAAQVITSQGVHLVSPAAEIDASVTVGRRKTRTTGTVTETDTAIAAGRRKTRALGVAASVETASTVTTGNVARPAIETDMAPAVVRHKARTVGPAADTSAAVALGRRHTRAAGPANETDSSVHITTARQLAVLAAQEADTAVQLIVASLLIESVLVTSNAPAGELGATHPQSVLAVSNVPSSQLEATHGV